MSTITGSSSAADISVVPTGNISSTNVQDALEELQTDINGLGGSGDMTKLVYDSDDDGIVDAAESVPWAGITGLPSTFPPDSHTHTYADITSGIIPHNTVAQLAVGADQRFYIAYTPTENAIHFSTTYGLELLDTTNTSSLLLQSGGVYLYSDAGELRFTTTDLQLIDYRVTQKGLEYAADYSANYTNRSLVDKEYVDNSIPAPGVTDSLAIAYAIALG